MIKRFAHGRRYFDTRSECYVNHQELAQMLEDDTSIEIVDGSGRVDRYERTSSDLAILSIAGYLRPVTKRSSQEAGV